MVTKKGIKKKERKPPQKKPIRQKLKKGKELEYVTSRVEIVIRVNGLIQYARSLVVNQYGNGPIMRLDDGTWIKAEKNKSIIDVVRDVLMGPSFRKNRKRDL